MPGSIFSLLYYFSGVGYAGGVVFFVSFSWVDISFHKSPFFFFFQNLDQAGYREIRDG